MLKTTLTLPILALARTNLSGEYSNTEEANCLRTIVDNGDGTGLVKGTTPARKEYGLLGDCKGSYCAEEPAPKEYGLLGDCKGKYCAE